jgi:hypothetical protein
MAMRQLLGPAAVLEAITGLALMIHPTLVTRLLFGSGVSGVGMALSRIAGIALLALGVACWPSREAGNGGTPAVQGMLAYSVLVTIYLVYLGGVAQLAGVLLWPAVAAHAVLTLLLIAVWRKERQPPRRTTP